MKVLGLRGFPGLPRPPPDRAALVRGFGSHRGGNTACGAGPRDDTSGSKVVCWRATDYCVKMQKTIVSASILLLCLLRESVWRLAWPL